MSMKLQHMSVMFNAELVRLNMLYYSKATRGKEDNEMTLLQRLQSKQLYRPRQYEYKYKCTSIGLLLFVLVSNLLTFSLEKMF